MDSAAAVRGLVLDADHEYWWHEQERSYYLVGCTNSLKGVGLINVAHYTEEGMIRGTWVHDRIEARLNGKELPPGSPCDVCDGTGEVECQGSDNLDVYMGQCHRCWGSGRNDAVDVRQPYVEAALQYLKDTGVEPLFVEFAMADRLRRMAGKPDVIGITSRDRYRLIDWKTGGHEDWHAYQTAWYEHLARVNGFVEGLCERIVVTLRPDGTYNEKPYTDRNDWKVADAARIVEQAKRAA